MLLITERIMGCMLVGAAAAAASSTCRDFVLSSDACIEMRGECVCVGGGGALPTLIHPRILS